MLPVLPECLYLDTAIHACLSPDLIIENALKSREAVCIHIPKLQSNQSLCFFIFSLVLSRSFNISNKRIFKNKWYTADFKLRGLCKKRVFLVPPRYKTKQDTSAKKKENVLSSVCVYCFWQKKKTGMEHPPAISVGTGWKGTIEFSSVYSLWLWQWTGTVPVSIHTFCISRFSPLHWPL